KTFRNEKFPAYKANRDAPPEDLVPQFPYFRKIVRAMNIPVLELSNYEADDVIGTVAKKMSRKKLKTIIVTGDKDLMQLVTDKVEIFDSMKEKEIRAPEVLERFGVLPEQVADVLGLAGDSSDNIPGVPGIGEKTAAKLIQQFGSVENLYKKLGPGDGLTDKLREKLKTHQKEAFLYKELATIMVEVPLEYDFKDFALEKPDPVKMNELFKELEFNRFLIEETPVVPKSLSHKDYHLILQKGEWMELVERLSQSKGFAIDLETTAIDPMLARIVGLSFSLEEGQAYYVPVGHTKASLQLLKESVLKDLKPVLEEPKIPKIGQNIKYDLTVLERYGIHAEGVLYDTMIASYLLKPEGNHNMELLAKEYLAHQVTTYKDVVGTGKSQINFSDVDLSTACEYSCEDADVTFRLHQILFPKIKEEGLEKLFLDLEMPLLRVLLIMEMNGIRVDPEALGSISKEYE
ncbi:MAG: 5'-3' exonuclease H3TH domain-containing protein, partial [bacterium]|nr:5'-3' exonuclease H3TH domain-containing protein [bacterium]